MRLEAELIGESPQMGALRDTVRRLIALPSDTQRWPPLLLEGETGTGKGLLARVIHRASVRHDGPFVDVNCAAIPETMLEAEMFGYERGAFTDARRAKPGLFQTAHRGTIFLDEVGLLPEALQAKLLKVLEERVVRRLGSTRNEPIDTWIIAATNEPLVQAMRERRFREDLYHRLAVVSVRLPPLRERDRDVLLLAEHFLSRARADYGLVPRTLASDAQAALLAHRWPGNVRELSNVMERVALLSESTIVTAEMLGLGRTVAAPSRPTRGDADTADAAKPGDEIEERQVLLDALQETDWNISRAAARLGLTRNKIRYRIERYGLRPGMTREAAATPPPNETIGPERPSPAPSPPFTSPRMRWERRRVTIMRAMVTAHGNGDTTRLIETFVEKVQTFGGRTEELSSTGIVAAFGLEPVEDAPRRAAHAAMAIQRAAARAGTGTSTRTVAVAIHVVEAMIGRVGDLIELDQDAKRDAGDALDALLTTGNHEGIVVSPTAMPFLERRFDLAPLGALPVTAYRLPGAETSGLEATARTAVHLVGRQQDLDLLTQRLHSAMRGKGQVVGITGDAGIGKSRLLLEFQHGLDPARTTCLEGHCLSYATDIPYLPIRDIIRADCEITETDTPDVIGDKIKRTLAALDLDAADGAPYLLHLLGAERAPQLFGLDPSRIKTRILELLCQICVRSSRDKTLVIVMEDLHWGDRASHDCLVSLGDAIAGARMLLVATYRPGYRPPWIEKSYATQIALQPLTAEESVTIVRALLGPVPVSEDVLHTILVKAEGNPFFLEELARAFRDRRPGGAALHVPDTIEEVLRARIDWLGPDDRHILQSAAVIGRGVPATILRTITDLPNARLQASIRTLQAAEFLFEVPVGAEPEYWFKHALTREVAYGLLAAPERRALHARIVEVIEKLAADRVDEYVERLAYHARAGELWKRATGYLRQAGARAFAHSANHEAVAWFEQSLEAITHLPETPDRQAEAADVHLDLRNALTLLGEHARALGHLRETAVLARRIGDQRRLGRALSFEANSLFLLGENQAAIDVGGQARAIAEALGDIALRTTTDMYVGRAHLRLGEFPGAIEIFGNIVATLTDDLAHNHLGSPVLPSVFARAHLVEALSTVGRFAEALKFSDDATALADTVKHAHSIFWAYRAAGLHHFERGEIERAARALERAHALSRTHDMPTYVPIISSELGLAWALGGGAAEAVPLVEDAVSAAGPATYTKALLLLGEVYLLAGRVDAAADAATRAVDLFRRRRERGYEACGVRLFGEIAVRRTPADYAAAEEHYQTARALADELGMRPLAARCQLGLARVFRQTARRPRAAQALQAARAAFAEMGMSTDLALSEAELAALA